MAAARVIPKIRSVSSPKEVFRNAVLYEPSGPRAHMYSENPQMVILFTWLGAKEKYAHKFVQSWNAHGFHVMHVTTNVLDLLMPKTKCEATTHRVVDYLLGKDKFNVILHGLSVGGFMGTRVYMNSSDTLLKPRITHQIYDSFMNTCGLSAGVVHAVSPPWNKIAGKIGNFYYNNADLSIFRSTEWFLENTAPAIPTFYMHSLGDYVAKYEWIQQFVEASSENAPTSLLLLPEEKKIPHVALFRKLGEEAYMSSIFKFLNINKLPVNTDFEVNEEAKSLGMIERSVKN